ncbi:MAG: methylenetetrahydrofolate reductase [Candidatus Gygaella obscura]|nr:methylenetetrahydrofolate reductase [Candidatus Gygaella obscura]
MSKLETAFKNKKFAVTSEIGPPKGILFEQILMDNISLRGRVDAINVTDLQSSVMRLGSLAFSKILLDNAIEPVFQLTCRDRNRLALQSDLLSAAVLGIENVLLLTGDHPILGDHPQAKAVYDLDSVQLLDCARKLTNGVDLCGNKLKGSPKLFLGAVVNPGVETLDLELLKMEKKIKAGAQFFQTQAVYDMDSFDRFMKKAKTFNVPIMAGIVLLKSVNMAKYLNDNVAGINVPEALIKRMEKSTDKVKTSIDIATELINNLKSNCQGVHIMPIGWDKYVVSLLDQAGL